MDKVEQVAEHVNMILRYIPYIQTNFVLGLDGDAGPEPFELTKQVRRPGARRVSRPTRCSRRSAGRRRSTSSTSAPARVLPFPFHFLNNNHAMNVRPKNYTWPEFYDRVIDLTRYSFSWRAIAPAVRAATATMIPKWMNVVRAMSSEGWGRIEYHTTIRRLLDTDRSVRDYLEGETDVLPAVLPRPHPPRPRRRCTSTCPTARCTHDPNAYLESGCRPGNRAGGPQEPPSVGLSVAGVSGSDQQHRGDHDREDQQHQHSGP